VYISILTDIALLHAFLYVMILLVAFWAAHLPNSEKIIILLRSLENLENNKIILEKKKTVIG